MKQILILHIAWMRDYCGLKNDKPYGQFGHMTQGGSPHKAFNFLPYKDRCYGYAAVSNGRVNLQKLGGDTEAEYLDNILVIWTATHPSQRDPISKRRYRYVVGWYNKARVSADMLERSKIAAAKELKDIDKLIYIASANAFDCCLLKEVDRIFEVPAMIKGYPGVSPAFYPSENSNQEWILSLRDYIETKSILENKALKNIIDNLDGATSERREYLREVFVRDAKHVKELKKLYGGRCQISGQKVLEDFSVDITEAHHIRWLTRGGSDEKDNMIVLSPNLHAAIHATNAEFNWSELSFDIGGKKFPVILNKHLKNK
ncbi:hypothetical protein [Methylobacterium thuringiense]|uniref:HNH endonuclease n=1 Tax=Methylobacterium thuringiense TaxID=1003091 RepID=A0ABQ4TL10_9HYPH|nr:hypothetical protein [Methylobacterium thuringiense]GJE54757.1 hypothetical protein EKPJFOCH_1239 [Methylobacterium thuringiense]